MSLDQLKCAGQGEAAALLLGCSGPDVLHCAVLPGNLQCPEMISRLLLLLRLLHLRVNFGITLRGGLATFVYKAMVTPTPTSTSTTDSLCFGGLCVSMTM